MLTFFKVRRSFHNLTVSLIVDLDAKSADFCATRDRRIIRLETMRLHMANHDFRTPEGASAWLNAHIESWHRHLPSNV